MRTGLPLYLVWVLFMKNYNQTKYLVLENGQVFNSITNKQLKPQLTKNGYLRITIYDKGKKRFLLHRLVAYCYLSNNENKSQINHIDGNKLNNNVSNLEYATQSENIRHSFEIGLRHGKKGENHVRSKLILDLETGIFYFGRREVANAVGIKSDTFKHRIKSNYLNFKNRFLYI